MSFNYFFRDNDSKQGKGKILFILRIVAIKKSSSDSLADENKLSDKSVRSINDTSLDHLSEIKNLRLRNINKVSILNINNNSLPVKHIDVAVIRETKLDNSFPTSQFLVKSLAEPFRLDQNTNGVGVMICI